MPRCRRLGTPPSASSPRTCRSCARSRGFRPSSKCSSRRSRLSESIASIEGGVSDVDLTKHPPRRWSDTIEGVAWLGRIIDKARAYDAGTLGIYLFGQSPVDASFLRAAGVGYGDVLEATRKAADDAGVLTEIERIAPGATDRLRQW